ncbi:MAG: ParB/RepB/Spo0J family partition protein [Pirellulales bacterium]|nr:ParB/RepB/Spo0J family partition protein [Pirellulales bacterium]
MPRSIARQAADEAMTAEREAVVQLSVGPDQVREPDTGVVQVDVHLIEGNPYQPRKEFAQDDIDGLAGSIREHGLLQPLVVRRVDESYQLIAGERRLRAAQQAGCREVPVKVVEADDRRMTELALVENLQRKDLGPLEKAASFQRYLQTHGCAQAELAARLHLDRSTVANFIRLLELPYRVQEMLRSGDLTQGHARALLPLGEEDLQNEMCQRIIREGLNVRQVEQLVQEMIAQADTEPLAAVEPTRPRSSAPTAKDDQIASLEQELRSALGMKVRLSHNARGRGKLVVHFSNHDEFERLRERLIGGPPS